MSEMEVEAPLEDMSLWALKRLGDGWQKEICRACLSEAKPPSPLFIGNETLADLVWRCAGVLPAQGDGLPEALCSRCCADLSIASQFRARVLKADRLLQHYTKTLVKSEQMDTIKEELISPEQIEDNICKQKKKKQPKTEHNAVLNVDIKCEFQYDDEVSDQRAHTPVIEDKQKPQSYTCEICKRPLRTKSSLQYHMKSMHSGKKRVGNVSGSGAERRFHCVECDYSTQYSQSLVYHKRVHTGEKPFKCDVCDRCFSQPGSLSSHKKTHSDKTYFTCAKCGKQFKYKETYESHKNVHIEEKKYTCPICSKKLKSRKTLEGHMSRHVNVKNYSCETCGATFVTHVDLLNHSRKHRAEKKYMCNLCDFRTYVKKGLETHLRRHTGERPFKCDLCELSCYTKGELKCHRRKHTREKNYSCPVCEMKFIYSPSVNKHMLKMHGIKYNRINIVDRRIIK
ncbi:uncharacterized protein LOC143920518 [Arctopsyche grandis]|uniref:uncharacterized protein LOC143920518 n=1 Tax=Arctopsyche grandis TaxID=121162 RepID=UPI00406D63C3